MSAEASPSGPAIRGGSVTGQPSAQATALPTDQPGVERGDDGPAFDMAVATAMLRRVAAGRSGPVLRVYRPHRRMVAFGRRDLRLAGFDRAVDAARAAGFTPVVRPTGGRVVACTPQTLIVDHASPDPQWPSGLDARFTEYGALWTSALGRLGLDARVGEVPGEYCPGSSSINARGQVKLVGTAQRMVRGAWLFSSVLVHDDADEVRAVLESLYGALELPFEGASVGSVADELGDGSGNVTLDLVEAVVLAAYDAHDGLRPSRPDEGLLDEARGLLDDHRL